MELNPREAAFVYDVLESVENSDSHLPSEQVEASRLRRRAEAELVE